MTLGNMKHSAQRKNDTKFRRGYRFGLATTSDMLKRYIEYYQDNAEVRRILTIIVSEVPLIGMNLSDATEANHEKEVE